MVVITYSGKLKLLHTQQLSYAEMIYSVAVEIQTNLVLRSEFANKNQF